MFFILSKCSQKEPVPNEYVHKRTGPKRTNKQKLEGVNMNELKINGIYKHFKGDYYLVEGIAKYSETKEEMVLYRKTI